MATTAPPATVPYYDIRKRLFNALNKQRPPVLLAQHPVREWSQAIYPVAIVHFS